MKTPDPIAVVAAALGGLVLLGPQAALAQDAAPSISMQALQRCGAIAADEARHACTDEALRQAGLLASPEARSAERRKVFGVQVPSFPLHHVARRRADAEAESAPVRSGGPTAVAQAAPPPEDDDRITATLDKVILEDGKYKLVTAEGAVWRQVESDAVRPEPRSGQAMVIRHTSLGGFACTTARWTTFRCYRDTRSAQ